MNYKENINQIFSYMLLRYVKEYGVIPSYLTKVIRKSVLRLLDSKIIIEDNFESISELIPAKIKQDLPEVHNDDYIFEQINMIKNIGFGSCFQTFTGQLGAIMVANCASETQKIEVNDWVEEGKLGTFLMTDRGGPNLSSWFSDCQELDNVNIKLIIDKIWGISAHTLGFGLISVKKDKTMTPLAFLVPPKNCESLEKVAIGLPFLDGYIQLGNVKGEIILPKKYILSSGGISGISRFLFLARPRFILAVISHLYWLISQKRILINKKQYLYMEFVKHCAQKIISEKTFDRYSVDKILALKFLNNEFLLDLVVCGNVYTLADQRDLLALSKMEGSSYRCLYEIYMKHKRTNG